jgi:vacuolar-type H+-ATPase subunit I/STV1
MLYRAAVLTLNQISEEEVKEEPKANVMPDTTNMTKREKLNARKAYLKNKKKLSKQEEDEVLLLEYEEEQLNEEEGVTSEPTEVRESPRKPTAVQEEKTHREVEQQQARQRRRSAFKYKAEVIYEYKSEDAQRLSIKPGDVIVILEQGEAGGWWLGELNGQEGYFPENYCKIIKPQRSISLKQDASPAIKAIQAQLGFLNAAWYDERNKPTESKEI